MKKFLKNYFTPDEQKILIFLLIFGFLGISLKFWGMKLQDKNINTDSLKVKKKEKILIDLRTASVEQLITVPGIGKKKAKQIMEFRNKFGFHAKSDLMKIKGIGKKTYAKLERYFVDFGEKSQKKLMSDTTKVKNKKNKIHQDGKMINLNTATYEDLISIKGIGPKKAKDILELRKALGGRFTDIKQLTQIKGIGDKTVEKLKKFITVE